MVVPEWKKENFLISTLQSLEISLLFLTMLIRFWRITGFRIWNSSFERNTKNNFLHGPMEGIRVPKSLAGVEGKVLRVNAPEEVSEDKDG